MSVSSLSSSNSFGGGRYYGLSHDEASQVALSVAMEKTKKRQRNHKIAYLSVPLVAGAAAAILTKGNSSILQKEVSGRAAKLVAGLNEGGSWLGALAAWIGIGALSNKMANKSESYDKFRTYHPILTFVGEAATVLGGLMAARYGANKLYSKLSPSVQTSISNGIGEFANKLNNFKAPKYINDIRDAISTHTPQYLKNLKSSISEYTPEALKDFGRVLVSWAAPLTLFGTFMSSLTIPARMKADYQKTYEQLRGPIVR